MAMGKGNLSFVGQRRTKQALNSHTSETKHSKITRVKSSLEPLHPCPYTDGNTCMPDCPMYGKTVVPVWDFASREERYKNFEEFEGCLVAAGMLALVSLANEK